MAWKILFFRSADNLHRVDLEPGIKPITIFIAGPFGRKKKEVYMGLGHFFSKLRF